MDDERKDHRNFVSVYRGFAYVGEKLEPYTEHGLKTTYQHIYWKLAGKPECHVQCSNVHKSQTSKWCESCKSWRNLLQNSRRNKNVSWEKTHSWQWQESHKNIAEVYLPASWENDSLDLKDLSTACFIWENCLNEFNIRTYILKKIREYRNKYFAHNSSLKVTDSEKAKVFDVLTDLLKDQDVQNHINVQDCLSGLEEIKKGLQIEDWMNKFQNLLKKHGLTLSKVDKGHSELQRNQEDIKLCVQGIQTNQLKIEEDLAKFKDDLPALLKEQRNRKHYFLQWLKTGFGQFCVISTTVILVLFLLYICWDLHSSQPAQLRRYSINTGCVSEQYSVPFPQDLPLLGYLQEHKSLTGRKWLMEHLKSELITPGNSQISGVVLIAEMGYGKSAFAGNLLCPESNELPVFIQKHIVAFHICKFDVRSTRSVERFIRRLVGFFAMKSPEYGNIISLLPETSVLYNRDSCEEELEACFDQGISIPIKQLKNVPDAPWIVLIDALDECVNSGKSPLLELLASRIHKLPKWLKFLITSRNITSLTMLGKMKLEYLLSDDPRNREDIKEFILKSFPDTSNPQMVARLIDKSEGSFVYVIQALKWLEDRGEDDNIPDFPSELSDIYEINFDRQFKNVDFTMPKAILEIICATINPLSKVNIYNILKSDNTSLNMHDFEGSFSSLSFFLRVDDNVRVSHQALFNWLVSVQNIKYDISLQAGHAFFSKYMFSTMDGNGTSDLVELAIHVANSDSPTLTDIFVSSAAIHKNFQDGKSLLHKLIWKTPSVKVLELMLQHCPDVNIINEGNVTPAFVAAAKGNVDQLILLHKKGAYLNFTVKGDFFIFPYSVFDKIDMMKKQYYSGYSLLHIAAQHGHVPVTQYILNQNKSLIYLENALGLHAGNVACENGHLNVIKLLYSLNSKLFKYRCMFYASKNNHVHILKWLVQNGVTFKCISDEESKKAAKSIETVSFEKRTEYAHVYFPNDIVSHSDIINPLDIWWRVLKMDPLNIAIRYGSLHAATFLIETFPTSLNCCDALGYTASLASIFFNHTDLLPLVSSNLQTDKCCRISEHLQNMESLKHLHLQEMNQICPEGSSLAHLVALYSLDKEIIIYVFRNRFAIKWNEPDTLGNYPVHYAAASNNIVFLYLLKEGTLEEPTFNGVHSYTDILASNGSTVYHIAAISCQILTFYQLTNSLKTPIPELKDNRGRGILHYIVLRQFYDFVGRAEYETHVKCYMIFNYLVNTSNHDITSCDQFGRNILHYALRHGHHMIVNNLLIKYQTQFDSMLSQRDHDGFRPIPFAIKNYERGSHPVVRLPNCAFFDVFFQFCSASESLPDIMSSWELGLFYLIRRSPLSYCQYFEPDLKYIMTKSPYLLTATLVYCKKLDVKILKQHLVSDSSNEFSVLNQISIARHKPSAFIACRRKLVDSPLHYIAFNFDHKDSVFSTVDSDVSLFLHFVFSKTSSKFNCPDENGYNIFHYSLLGGNIQTAQILMWRNITTINEKVSYKDVFYLALASRQRQNRKNFVKCSEDKVKQNQISCTDIFLLEFFEKNKHIFTYSDFCKKDSKELSLVHLLAASGMADTLKAIARVFGKNILNCLSKDHFTPFYFGKLFGQDSVLSSVVDKKDPVLPHPGAEEWLIWSLIHNFLQVDRSSYLFYFSHDMSPLKLSYRQMAHCQRYVSNVMEQTFTKAVSELPYIQHLVATSFFSMRFQILISCNQFIEYIYFNLSDTSVTCGSVLVKLTECFEYYHGTELVLRSNIFPLKLLKKMLQKLSPASKTFSKFFNNTQHRCTEKSTKIMIGKRALFNLMILLKKTSSDLNTLLTEAAVLCYIEGGKSVDVVVPSSYTFLQGRMKRLKFQVNEKFSIVRPYLPLVHVDAASIYDYKHITILKQMLFYRNLKDHLTVNEFRLFEYGDVHVKTFSTLLTMLKEPFIDLK